MRNSQEHESSCLVNRVRRLPSSAMSRMPCICRRDLGVIVCPNYLQRLHEHPLGRLQQDRRSARHAAGGSHGILHNNTWEGDDALRMHISKLHIGKVSAR